MAVLASRLPRAYGAGAQGQLMNVVAVVLICGVVLAGCGQRSSDPAETDGAGEELWGRSFSSVSVTDERSRVVPDEVVVGFEERNGRGLVRWGGCNATGAEVVVTEERIRLQEGPQESTAIGCPPEGDEGDRWLLKFFASDPYWELKDDRLVLTSGGGWGVIVLEPRPGDRPALER